MECRVEPCGAGGSGRYINVENIDGDVVDDSGDGKVFCDGVVSEEVI